MTLTFLKTVRDEDDDVETFLLMTLKNSSVFCFFGCFFFNVTKHAT